MSDDSIPTPEFSEDEVDSALAAHPIFGAVICGEVTGYTVARPSPAAPRVAPGGEPDLLSALRSLANGHASGHYGGGVQAAAVCEDARDALITLRASVTALDARLATAERNGCPCTLVTPCRSSCTCADPELSGGCSRCARYGSPEQRLAMATAIVTAEASRARAEQALEDARAIFAERHFRGHPITGRQHDMASVMVSSEWYARLKAALRPDETPETPRPASTADLDQRDRALGR